jgi:hypothetical protein
MKQAAFTLAFLALLSTSALTQIPRTLSYQAVLTDNAGVPKPDGTYTITFRLYTSAAGGAALWTEVQTLQVKRGLFSAVLGSVTPIAPSVTFDRQYWLSLQVAPDAEMATRLPLASVGYSFSALMADSARYAKGTVAAAPLALAANVNNPNYVLSSTATGTGGGVLGVSDHGIGVVGEATGATGVNYGVAGNSFSPDGIAVSGWNLATTGTAVGVRALTNSPAGWGAFGSGGASGIGVVGQSLGTTGVNYGVAGNSSSPDGFAVSGRNLATTGNAVGVIGATNSSAGWGVYGAGGATGIGVIGVGATGIRGGSSSATGFGVWGEAFRGVVGKSFSVAGIGVYGEAGFNASGDCRGMYGVAYNALGDGIVGENFATTGSGRGVWGVSHSPDGVAVYGNNTDANGWAAYFDGKMATRALHILGGADVAEPFDTDAEAGVEPGSLMVIDPANPGHLTLSLLPYDGRVAGIVSGAGGVHPGITLQQEGMIQGKSLVAIAGRVYCLADARTGAIRPGDLLTTSSTPGHAMKARNKSRAHGAIIGKAMTGLNAGTGLVLVLVNLQ